MFGRSSPEEHRLRNAARREANLRALAQPVRTLHEASYVGTTTPAAPKMRPLRDQALRDMAQGRPCLLLVPACCNARQDTTCTCHENQGKGMGLKQSDERSAWGCVACHRWYDQSGAPREHKRAVFEAALQRQIQAWIVVAADPSEPQRFRRAAARALELHGVTACT